MKRKKIGHLAAALAAAGFLAFSGIGAVATFSIDGGEGAFGAHERTAFHAVIVAIGTESFLTPPVAAPAR
jgi:hypothetical protein